MNTAQNTANQVIDNMVEVYKSEAIPCLIAGCVAWAVFHGGTEIIKQSLRNAIQLADDMHDIQIKTGN